MTEFLMEIYIIKLSILAYIFLKIQTLEILMIVSLVKYFKTDELCFKHMSKAHKHR